MAHNKTYASMLQDVVEQPSIWRPPVVDSLRSLLAADGRFVVGPASPPWVGPDGSAVRYSDRIGQVVSVRTSSGAAVTIHVIRAFTGRTFAKAPPASLPGLNREFQRVPDPNGRPRRPELRAPALPPSAHVAVHDAGDGDFLDLTLPEGSSASRELAVAAPAAANVLRSQSGTAAAAAAIRSLPAPAHDEPQASMHGPIQAS